MVKVFVAVLSVACLVLGCGSSDRAQDDSNFVQVDENDEAMNAAIEKGKATFDFFKENWQTMENDGYSVKFGLPTTTDELEYIWFNPLEINDGVIRAECANKPIDIPGLNYQDVRELSEDQVADWMIIVGDKCYGGCTIAAMSQFAAPPAGWVSGAGC